MFYVVLLIGFTFQLFNNRVLFWIFTILLTIMACLRYGIGLDYFGYEFLYRNLSVSVLDEIKYGLNNQEVGFRAVGSFLKSIGFTYRYYLIFFALISLSFVAMICKKYSKNPTLSLLLFFCFYYLTWVFSGIRQGVVIAVGLYFLLRCIENNKTMKFIVIVALLSLIHSSAIVLIVLYFVSKLDFSRNKLIALSIFTIIFSLIPTGFLISKLTWFPFYTRIYPYLNTELSINLFDFQGLGRIIFLIIAFIYYDQYCKQSDSSKKIMDMYILSMVLYFVLQFSELAASRLAIYGKVLDIIILANILYLYRLKINKLVYTYSILALCFMYLFKESGEIKRAVSTDSVITPYVNVFNKDDYNFDSKHKLLIND